MMVIVYVEGPSDQFALRVLLKSLLDQKHQQGIAVQFHQPPPGHRKRSLITNVPRKAASILLNRPDAIVIAMPDLYPPNTVFPHQTCRELEKGILDRFDQAVRSKGRENDERLKRRFKVFCFKHDMEALILAAEEGLKNRLGIGSLKITWRRPVEDQDHHAPPKRVVERLFESQGTHYRETADAPMVLAQSNYQAIAEQCPQCFKPFVEFLTGLHAG